MEVRVEVHHDVPWQRLPPASEAVTESLEQATRPSPFCGRILDDGESLHGSVLQEALEFLLGRPRGGGVRMEILEDVPEIVVTVIDFRDREARLPLNLRHQKIQKKVGGSRGRNNSRKKLR